MIFYGGERWKGKDGKKKPFTLIELQSFENSAQVAG